MKPKKWDIYWADVPFTDGREIKARPVIIKEDGTAYVVVWYVTSQSPKPGTLCYNIRDWKGAGLSKPSNAHLDRAIRLEECGIHERIGRLSDMDILFLEMELARAAGTK